MRGAALLLLLAACHEPPAPRTGVPARIVSLLPSATELLYAVGAGEQLVGISTACDHPPEALSKPRVGSLTVDVERLLALRADLVVINTRMTRQVARDLETRGMRVLSIDPGSFDEIARTMRHLGELTGHREEGARAADAFLARAAAVTAAPGPTFYFEHSAEPLGTTGPESYVGEALRRAGGRNIFDGGWRLNDWESVLARDPEVILIGHDAREGIERRVGWKNLKAVKAGRVHFVDKTRYVYPTPRLLEGLEEAARIFHAKNP